MGWFNEQIKQREKNDNEMLKESYESMENAVQGFSLVKPFTVEDAGALGAINTILEFYEVKPRELPHTIKTTRDKLEYLLRPYGIMHRDIDLCKGWYKDSIGAVLGTRKDDNSTVAFIPKGINRYEFFDNQTKKWVRLDAKNENLFNDTGMCFYRAFAPKPLKILDLIKFMLKSLSVFDYLMLIVASLGITLLGLLLPKLSNILVGATVEYKSTSMLFGIAMFIICVTISSLEISAIKNLILAKIKTKVNISVESATIMRVLSIHTSFFK